MDALLDSLDLDQIDEWIYIDENFYTPLEIQTASICYTISHMLSDKDHKPQWSDFLPPKKKKSSAPMQSGAIAKAKLDGLRGVKFKS